MSAYPAIRLLLLVLAMTVGSRAADAGARVRVMTSVGLGRGVTAQQSEAALAKAMTYLHLDQRRAPRVVLFVTSTQSAQVQGIPPGTALYVARIHGRAPSLYHVWLMAAPNETVLTQGMVMALGAEFDLQLGRDGVERTTLAICRESRATVRVGPRGGAAQRPVTLMQRGKRH